MLLIAAIVSKGHDVENTIADFLIHFTWKACDWHDLGGVQLRGYKHEILFGWHMQIFGKSSKFKGGKNTI